MDDGLQVASVPNVLSRYMPPGAGCGSEVAGVVGGGCGMGGAKGLGSAGGERGGYGRCGGGGNEGGGEEGASGAEGEGLMVEATSCRMEADLVASCTSTSV